ncbi:MAG TPA: preprotein translocase subunit SecA [Candidatus Gracilibacteria bacterium]
MKWITSLLGNYNEKELKKLWKIVPHINEKEESLKKLSDDELKAQFATWKAMLTEHPEKVDDLMIDVFAGVKNACRRLVGHQYDIRGNQETWEIKHHYDVQLVGGIVLHQGKIAEMKTGEGKTLVCTLPVILNALTGRGVHVITVNDYLAERDADWMKPLYEFCGLSVGVIIHGKDQEQRREAYMSDITYGTNNEFGFDYLRDNMAQNPNHLVQRDLHFAIVDEVDSILVDEARTPLIISAPAEESTDKYTKYSQLIPRLKEDEHYIIEIKHKSVHLTESGITEMEKLLGVSNIYTEAGFSEVHHIEQALKAQVIMQKDIDYVVKDDQVIIIDEFTGRMMDGRRFSDGLHQALEAKERVAIQRESKTLATITFQNYFRLYQKLSGMTGTAETEAEEFAKIYRLDTIVIPTNRPITRKDLPDKIFQNERGKFLALAQEVRKLHGKGQPVLVGTISIEKSETLSALLHREAIPHKVLNAKYHESEAEIVSQAGQKGAVTIATNMAGRGTDIKLGEGVKDLGGLAILGTERHESRRIDNQLRGRSGRQGDPGFSQFYVAMSDDLMRRFGGDRMGSVMARLNLPETESIENSFISKSVENAQKKIEGFHFDARKHVVQYDDIINIHREKIYGQRRRLLNSEHIFEDLQSLIIELVAQTVDQNLLSENYDQTWDLEVLYEAVEAIIKKPLPVAIKEKIQEQHTRAEIKEILRPYIFECWETKIQKLPEEQVIYLTRHIILRSIDELWLDHIDEMTHLRDRVALSGYAQRDPIMEYKSEAFRMFGLMQRQIRLVAVSNLFRIDFSDHIKFEEADYSQAQTNQDEIEASLENTGEFAVNAMSSSGLSKVISGARRLADPIHNTNDGLTRQQRRDLERKEKKAKKK